VKKLFIVLLFMMACAANAAESPFKKGTAYLNFNFHVSGKSWTEIGNPSSSVFGVTGPNLLPGDSLGVDKLAVHNNQSFGNMATGVALEYALTNNLGLEFQYSNRSNDYEGVAIELAKPEESESGNGVKHIVLNHYYDAGRFSDRVLSLGCNYHLNFIGIRRLDVYTGFQLGIEEKKFSVHSRLKESVKLEFPAMEKEFWITPVDYAGNRGLLVYSHVAAGLNFFFTKRIAINLRSGLKIGSQGYESEFFGGAGLTVKL